MVDHDTCLACRSKSPIREDIPGLTIFNPQSFDMPKNGDLMLLPRASFTIATKSDHTSEPFILKLPDELLTEIARMVKACDDRETIRDRDTLALAKVCKIFYRIVQPFMFEKIYLRYPHTIAPACKPFRRLHRTLQANPSLGRFCKTLDVYISSNNDQDQTSGDYIIAEELVGWLPNVTSFSLYGGVGVSYTWQFLKQAFRDMAVIEELTLSGKRFDLEIAPVLDILQSTRLRTVHLHGIWVRKDRGTVIPIPKELERTSPITTLFMSEFQDTPVALQALLQLPKALQHLHFAIIYTRVVSWGLGSLQTLLDDHRTSLESISIGPTGRNMPNMSFLNYPKLETLKLPSWIFTYSPQATESLLAPNLHTFIWDFGVDGPHSEHWINFGPSQQGWLISFAALATKRKSALKKIEIIPNPDFWCNAESRQECTDPWNLVEEAREAMRPGGIELVYNRLWTEERIEFHLKIAREYKSDEIAGSGSESDDSSF